MDRAKFLAGLKANAVKLFPFTIPGFSEPIYLKALTLADIKAQIAAPEEPPLVKDRIAKDQFYVERSLAKLVRDETGALLFDAKDDAQMAELRAVLDNNVHNVNRLIQDAQGKLEEPTKAEVDAKGN